MHSIRAHGHTGPTSPSQQIIVFTLTEHQHCSREFHTIRENSKKKIDLNKQVCLKTKSIYDKCAKMYVTGTRVTIVKLCIHSLIHSFIPAVVSYDRSIASSKASSPQSAI